VTPRTSSERTDISPSGLPLACTFDDGFAVGYRYDGAGRTFCVGKPPLTAAGRCAILPPGQVGGGSDDFWVADEIDAAGRILREHYRNGISQTYGYDELGLTSKVDLFRPASGPAVDLFDLTIVRNSFGAPTSVTDGDTRGLDHSATYLYDGAGRLTDAAMGRAADQYSFSYRYDGLQNMISRQVSGPKEIGVLTGIYRYAERGYGPRQLTSITPGVAP
jgi:YD repeat-containing protein